MFENLESKKNKLIYLPLGIYWFILFIATTLPGKDLPKTGVSDKIEHFTAYFILSLLLNLTYAVQDKYQWLKRNFAIGALLTVAIYAGLDELHQLFIPGRSCDILDWSADMTGAILATLIFLIFLKKIFIRPSEN